MSKCITSWAVVSAHRAAVIGALALVAATVSPVAAEQQRTSCPAGRDASCICWTENGIAKVSCTSKRPAARVATPTSPSDQSPGHLAAASRISKEPVDADPPQLGSMTDEERRTYLQKRQDDLDREVLAAQRARFLARAAGKTDEEVEKLGRTFKDLQQRRHANLSRLHALGSAE